MSELPPGDVSVDAFKQWKPEAQQKALELLRANEGSEWRPFYCPNPTCDGEPHGDWDWQHARVDQRPPKWSDDWLTWVLKGGRGSGKTRTGAEVTHRVTAKVPRLLLVAPTGYDLRETMVEGVSGILACSPPDKRPLWEPSKKKLTWPNGCIAQGFSAEEPDRLRGPQSGYIWADEPAHWPLVKECWDNMQFGLRMKGFQPKIVATSTPKPTKWMKELLKDPRTITHSVSTYANLVNLAPEFRKTILDKYEGTRLGRQELHGEVLEDVEGALWAWEMFQWVDEPPTLTRIVVSVDPAGTANARSDETGIIVLGIGVDKNIYVLADFTGKYSPKAWGDKVLSAYDDFSADAVIAEKNYGADMVRYVLETAEERRGTVAHIELVQSRRGKQLRAEPIVALYERQKVFHCGKRGDLGLLEEEQTTWVPGEGDSPNRVDAMVHGATALAKNVMPATIADPNTLLRGRISPQNRHLRAI